MLRLHLLLSVFSLSFDEVLLFFHLLITLLLELVLLHLKLFFIVKLLDESMQVFLLVALNLRDVQVRALDRLAIK